MLQGYRRLVKECFETKEFKKRRKKIPGAAWISKIAKTGKDGGRTLEDMKRLAAKRKLWMK